MPVRSARPALRINAMALARIPDKAALRIFGQ